MCKPIRIGVGNGWPLSSKNFDMIVKSAMKEFSFSLREEIGLLSCDDVEGKIFISLEHLAHDSFNEAYCGIKTAMEKFPDSIQWKDLSEDERKDILWQWKNILQGMREEPRHDECAEAWKRMDSK